MIGVVSVTDADELMMMTARGKLQRIAVGEISVIGRNTQGVRIMSLDAGDTLTAVVRVPRDAEPAAAADSAGPAPTPNSPALSGPAPGSPAPSTSPRPTSPTPSEPVAL